MRAFPGGSAPWMVAAATIFLLSVLTGTPAVEAYQGYLKHPDVYGNQVVFTAEGDLWLANLDGSDVRRITSHPGEEYHAAFSPDGKWIAFSGDYDGNTDVFVMPAGGGEPRRLTWHPVGDVCLGWTPDGEKVYFRSWRHHPNRNSEIFMIPAHGGEPEKVPIGRARHFDIDPDSGRWAFNRSSGGGTWKRYRGGEATDIWVGHPDRADFARVTDFEGADIYPMWHGGRIYFLSDEGGTANIWSINPDGSDRRRHTNFDEWDARQPSMGPAGRIVFTLAGDIHLLDTADDSVKKLAIDLPSEQILTRERFPNAERFMTGWDLGPEGDRVLVVTRGEVYSVPVEEGVTLPLTHASGAREGRVMFDPEGERFAYITDESGEEAIATADAWGRGEIKVVKPPAKSGRYSIPHWSPDGKWIAYGDQSHTLWVVAAEGGRPRKVDTDPQEEIRDCRWSPDGRWLAYSKQNRQDIASIFIFDTKEEKTHQVTSYTTDDRQPAWDPDGRYLYFVSYRNMDAVTGWYDFESVVTKPNVLYMLPLRSDVENPFIKTAGLPPEEGEDEGEDEEAEKEEGEGDKEELAPVEIEFEGIAERQIELPVESGRYQGLTATSEKLFYLSLPVETVQGGPEDEDEPKATLMTFDLKEKEADTFVSGVSAYDLEAGAGKVGIAQGKGNLFVVDAGSAPSDMSDSQVSLGGIVLELDPRAEWRQIYYEGWRNMRDFYWSANMAHVDWEAMRDQYATLLPRIATRADLRDLMGELIGELSTGHTYVWGGDPGVDVPRRSVGVLGADVRRDGDYYRVEKIYRGDPADRVRSCLSEPGVDVKEGDYIIAINHQPLDALVPFEAYLDDLAGNDVVFTVNDRASEKDARDVVVTPMGSGEDFQLRYAHWVRENREHVAEETDGKIGYIHIPDMGPRGLSAFYRWYYPQLDKQGMIVDARWNGGGFVSQLILNRLMRELIWWDTSRWGGRWTYPYRTLNGPFVVLTNEFAGSDGDNFPAAVQYAGLAPVIGKRTWGGVVGLRYGRALVDGGMLTQPEYPSWRKDEGWIIEGHGVDPDIEVEDLPQELARGVDAQLERGVTEVMKLLRENPPSVPEFGPAPDKSRKAFLGEE